MIDGAVDDRILIAYWVVVAVLLVVPSVVRRLSWRRERMRLRAVIVAELAGPGVAAADAPGHARNQVEALAACTLGGTVAGAPSSRAYLCCTRQRLLVIEDQAVRRLDYGEIGRLALADSRNGDTYTLALETGDGPLRAQVARVDELVRLINVATNHGVAVGHLKK